MKCQQCGKEIPQGVLRCSCGCIQSETPGYYVPPGKKEVLLAKLGKGGIIAIVLILLSFFLFSKTHTPEAELFGKWKLEYTQLDRWTNSVDKYEITYNFTAFSGLKVSGKVNGTTQTSQDRKVTYEVNNGKLISTDGNKMETSDFIVSGNVLELDGYTLKRAGGMTKTLLMLLSIVLFFGSTIYLYKSFKE